MEPSDILICIVTTKIYKETRLKALRETWLKDANYMIFSDEEDIDNHIMKVSDDNTYKSNVEKTNEMLYWIHNFGTKKWYFYADDDVFVNMREMNEYVKTLDDNVVYGYEFTPTRSTAHLPSFWKMFEPGFTYLSGGAGIVISKKVVDIIYDKIHIYDPACADINIGLCIRKLQIPIGHDDRFHPFTPARHNCSNEIKKCLTFHKINIDHQYALHFQCSDS